MPERKTTIAHTVAVTWAAIAEVSLAGAISLWSLSRSARASAGYGLTGSIALLAVCMLTTALGAVLVVLRSRIGRSPRLAVGAVLVIVAGSTIPLALSDLFSPSDSAAFWPLALAIIGMCFVATNLTRKTAGKP